MSAPFLLEQSEVKPSPGPWRLSSNLLRVCANRDRLGGSLFVADCDSDHWSERGQDIANARLIAAAPELLEALDWLVQILPDPDLDNDELQRTWTKKARTAIRKATLGGAS